MWTSGAAIPAQRGIGMGKKKSCPEGISCKYKYEYQHQLEFSHDNNNGSALSKRKAAAAPVGAGRRLGRFDGSGDLVQCHLCRSYIHCTQLEDHIIAHNITTNHKIKSSSSSSSSSKKGKGVVDVIDLVGSPPFSTRPAESIKESQDREFLQSVEADVSLKSERDYEMELGRQAKEEQEMRAAIKQSIRDDEQRRFEVLREQQVLIVEPAAGEEGVIEVKFAVRAGSESSSHMRRFRVVDSFAFAVQFLRSQNSSLFLDDQWCVKIGTDSYAQSTHESFAELKIVTNSRMSVIVTQIERNT